MREKKKGRRSTCFEEGKQHKEGGTVEQEDRGRLEQSQRCSRSQAKHTWDRQVCL